MAETGKKIKASAKPKAEAKPKAAAKAATTATGKTAVKSKETGASEQVHSAAPSHAEIAELAQRFWAERGHHDGQAEQDWLRAERELKKVAS